MYAYISGIVDELLTDRAVLEAGQSTLMLAEGPVNIRGEIRALSDALRVESPEQ